MSENNLSYPKICKNTDGLYFIRFYMHNKRYRLFSGRMINSSLRPNTYPKKLRLGKAVLLAKEVYYFLVKNNYSFEKKISSLEFFDKIINKKLQEPLSDRYKKELKSFINKKDVIKNITENIKNKLSFKFKYELENLPKDIEDIQLKINHINDELKNSNLYLDDVERFNSIAKEIADLKESLLVKEDRWLNLLEMEEKIE